MPFWERVFRGAIAVRGPIKFGTVTGPVLITGALFPKSGTSGTGAGYAPKGSIYSETTRGTTWQNEGTQASPYWSPTSFDQPGLIAIHAGDFAGSDTKAEADTATSAVLGPHGFTILGDGVHETDSGALLAGSPAEGLLQALRLSSSATAGGDLCALSTPVVSGAGIYQPDQHGMALFDVELTNISALTARIVFMGFAGIVAVGETDVVTAATTVTTLTQNDIAALYMASTATDADRIIAAFSKAGTPSTQDYAVLTDLNTGVNMAAAGTAQRFRVEVDADGAVRMFIAKVLVFTGAAATLAVNQELNALVYASPTTTTQAEIDILRASFVMGRAA